MIRPAMSHMHVAWINEFNHKFGLCDYHQQTLLVVPDSTGWHMKTVRLAQTAV